MIASARCKGKSFFELGEDTKIAAATIVQKGRSITGCELPNTDFAMDGLCDEIATFINDFGYGEFTEEEIYLAMRLNARVGLKFPSGAEVEQIPFTGRTFNVDYLSKILNNYSALRTCFDRKCQNAIDGY